MIGVVLSTRGPVKSWWDQEIAVNWRPSCGSKILQAADGGGVFVGSFDNQLVTLASAPVEELEWNRSARARGSGTASAMIASVISQAGNAFSTSARVQPRGSGPRRPWRKAVEQQCRVVRWHCAHLTARRSALFPGQAVECAGVHDQPVAGSDVGLVQARHVAEDEEQCLDTGVTDTFLCAAGLCRHYPGR